MPDTAPSAPLRYDPSFEQSEPDEATTGAELTATMRRISETTSKDYGHAVRSVHAKSHGLLRGELNILDGLAPELMNGRSRGRAATPWSCACRRTRAMSWTTASRRRAASR